MSIICCGDSVYGQSVTSVKQVSKSAVVKAFPNPADDHFRLKVENVKVGFVSINDIVGKEIKRYKANPDHVYDVDFLRRGIYIIRVLDEKEELIKPLRLSKS